MMGSFKSESDRMFPMHSPPLQLLELNALQSAMLDASQDCIKIISLDGDLLLMNKSGCAALGVPEGSKFGMPWLSLLPPDLYDPGIFAIQEARQGRAARFSGRSESADGIIYWDNLLTPLRDEGGQVNLILCVSRDITQNTILELNLESALMREKLICGEMIHRVKNIFSVMSALAAIAEKEAAEDPNSNPISILQDKLAALSRASDAGLPSQQALVGVNDLSSTIKSVLSPYGRKCHINGQDAEISSDITTNLALFLHELATNSLKYGSLSSEDGDVNIIWSVKDRKLALRWEENGGPPINSIPTKKGFGSQMVERLLKATGGEIDRSWHTTGVVTEIQLPLGP